MVFVIRRKMPGESKPAFEYEHPSDSPTVLTFGSDRASSIRVDVTDPNERVHSRHCTLIYTGSGFRIDFERDTRVFVGDSDTPIYGLSDPFHDCGDKREIKLRLGMPVSGAEGAGSVSSRNPVFYIERTAASAVDLKAAKPRKPEGQVSYDPIEQVKRSARAIALQRWKNLGIVLSLLLLGAACSWFGWQGYQRFSWTSQVANQYFPSVGVVGVVAVDAAGRELGFEPTGTGWLCCEPQNGEADSGYHLVTNGHVWTASEELVARKTEPGQSARIVLRLPARDGGDLADALQISFPSKGGARTHTLYGDFGGYLDEKQLKAAAPNVYDAAAVPIDPLLNQAVIEELRKRERFALALPDAGPRVGESVGIVGYPVENLLYALSADSPIPKFYTPSVARRTSPFLGPESPNMPALLAVKAESAGGLSGSPVIGESNGRLQIVGMVMQANLVATKAQPQAALAAPETGSKQPIAALSAERLETYEPGRRFATSDVVFATDSAVVRELFVKPGAQRLQQDEAKSMWDMSRNNRYRNPVAADFTRLTAKPGCANLQLGRPSGKHQLGERGYTREETIAADEFFWIAAQYADNRSAALQIDVQKAAGQGPASGDPPVRVPGFAAFLVKPSPRAVSVVVSVRGDRGADVNLFVQRCGRGVGSLRGGQPQ